MDVSVTAGSDFYSDSVTVVDPGAEIAKGDGTDIGGHYFTRTANLGSGAFDILSLPR